MSESEDSTPRPLHLAPSTWMRETGVRLSDDLGWTSPDIMRTTRLEIKDQQDPVTREEFIERAKLSDVLRWPDPLYDEREEPSEWFVSRLAEALKSEFGIQFGMGINADDASWKRVARGIALKMRVTEHDESGGTMIVAFDPRESE